MRSLVVLALLLAVAASFILQELPLDRFERSDPMFSREIRAGPGRQRLFPSRYMLGRGIQFYEN